MPICCILGRCYRYEITREKSKSKFLNSILQTNYGNQFKDGSNSHDEEESDDEGTSEFSYEENNAVKSKKSKSVPSSNKGTKRACDICGNVFNSKPALYYHKTIHHTGMLHFYSFGETCCEKIKSEKNEMQNEKVLTLVRYRN